VKITEANKDKDVNENFVAALDIFSAEAPSTALRAVPLPRVAGQDEGKRS
jgi:hypothetical protein